MKKQITATALALSLVLALFASVGLVSGSGKRAAAEKVSIRVENESGDHAGSGKTGIAESTGNVGTAGKADGLTAGLIKSGGKDAAGGDLVADAGSIGTGSSYKLEIDEKIAALVADIEDLKEKVKNSGEKDVPVLITGLERVSTSVDSIFDSIERIDGELKSEVKLSGKNETEIKEYRENLQEYRDNLGSFQEEVRAVSEKLEKLNHTWGEDKENTDLRFEQIKTELTGLTESKSASLMASISGLSEKLYAYMAEGEARFKGLDRQIANLSLRLDVLTEDLNTSNGNTKELIDSLRRGINAAELAERVVAYAGLARAKTAGLTLPDAAEGKRGELLAAIDLYESEITTALDGAENLDISSLMQIKTKENVYSRKILEAFYDLLNEATSSRLDERIDEVSEDLAETREELAGTEEDLAATKEDLENTKEDLASTKDDLASTKEDLAETKEDLESTKEDLENTKEDLENTKEDLASGLESVRNELESAREELSENFDRAIENAKTELTGSIETEKENAKTERDALAGRLEGLEERLGITYIKGFKIAKESWESAEGEYFYEIRNAAFTADSHVEVIYTVLPQSRVRYEGDTGYMRIYIADPADTYVERIMIYNG